jgi:hypothetical protein
VSAVAMVWPCALPVDAYVAAGCRVEFPRPDCPSCEGPMVLWSGYWRHVREAGCCRKIFVPRLRCSCCRVTHALLPAFVLAGRLDAVETVGRAIEEVAGGRSGARPAAERAGVPHKAELMAQASDLLAAETAERHRQVVVIVDEAHLLQPDQLEELRLLTLCRGRGYPEPVPAPGGPGWVAGTAAFCHSA